MKVRIYYYILVPKSKNPRSVIFPLSEFTSVCKWVLDRRTLLFALVLLTFWGVSKRVEMIWKYKYLNKKEWWYWLDFNNVHQKGLFNQWKFLKYHVLMVTVTWLIPKYQLISTEGYFSKRGKGDCFWMRGYFSIGSKLLLHGWSDNGSCTKLCQKSRGLRSTFWRIIAHVPGVTYVLVLEWSHQQSFLASIWGQI